MMAYYLLSRFFQGCLGLIWRSSIDFFFPICFLFLFLLPHHCIFITQKIKLQIRWKKPSSEGTDFHFVFFLMWSKCMRIPFIVHSDNPSLLSLLHFLSSSLYKLLSISSPSFLPPKSSGSQNIISCIWQMIKRYVLVLSKRWKNHTVSHLQAYGTYGMLHPSSYHAGWNNSFEKIPDPIY